MQEDIDQSLLQRYEIIQKIRKTNNGIIWKAIDRKQHKLVAIKKINPNVLIKNLRETHILQEISKIDTIIKFFIVVTKETITYIIYEFIDMDLHTLIQVSILELQHMCLILYQVALTLYYIHLGGLVHLNLTPYKILLNQDCQVKVIGFSMAQMIPVSKNQVGSLNYTAPEVLLQGQITFAQDIWAFGCIMGEMLCGHKLFVGNSSLSQLEKIVELIGKPESSNINEISNHILAAIQAEKKKSFTQITNDANAQDLLRKTLTFFPGDRIAIDELLKHKFFQQFYNPADLRRPPQRFAISNSQGKPELSESHNYQNNDEYKPLDSEKRLSMKSQIFIDGPQQKS